MSFLSLNYLEAQEKNLNQEDKFCQCQSFGEAASVILINWSAGQFFKGFYKGLLDEVLTWFIYPEVAEFELMISFRFEIACSNELSTAIFQRIVKPELLPIEFRHGREKPPTSYEFYNPSIVARQLGFGQLPPGLFFANKLRPREVVTQPLEFLGIQQFEVALPQINAEGWKCGPFSSNLFKSWWQEWAQHLFYSSVAPFCQSLDPNFQPNNEVPILSIFITRLPI